MTLNLSSAANPARTVALAVLLLLVTVVLAGCAGNDEEDQFGADSGEQQIYDQAQRYLNSATTTWRSGAAGAGIALPLRSLCRAGAARADLRALQRLRARGGGRGGGPLHSPASAAPQRRLRLLHEGAGNRDFQRGLPVALLAHGRTKRDTAMPRRPSPSSHSWYRASPTAPTPRMPRDRMVYLRNLLARNEIHVANYYFRRGAYLAARTGAATWSRTSSARRRCPTDWR
jgi:outer membrane protein assembly factor BamD